MILQYKNRCLQHGGNISFIVTGTAFPTGTISLIASKAFTITVYHNDGTVPITYNSVSNAIYLYPVGNTSIDATIGRFGGKTFADGNKTDRIITITCSDWNAITSLGLSGQQFSKTQVLGVPFRLMRNLAGFSAINGLASGTIYQHISELDQALFTLPKLRTLQLGGISFEPTSRYYGYMQPQMLNPQLTNLAIGGPGFTGKTFGASNLTAINGTSMPNLITFGFNAGMISGDDNGFGEGPFPMEWTTLSKLASFNCNATQWTKLPDRLNDLSPTVISLGITYCANLKAWATDLSNLPNLATLILNGCTAFPTTLPSYIGNLTKLKTLNYNGVFPLTRTAGTVDELIQSWYEYVVNNVSLTDSNTVPFRGMKFDLRALDVVNNPNSVQIPEGTYQASTGFVQGSNNGTPTSSLERLYVLEKNYGHTWSYRTQ
ncbi:hypothetical protein SAMN05421788_101846 [Filimonas lacunae]|uniref:Leucine rich repeat-containing protein n=1 Tax=Filimonas lacunae TaxID=477680 RepID=A0A173MPQ4_9BACT|nr:hypothetical protein [Filimonas lacunae]BAV09410.1 hypothetical protein FLA_5458 [Filimonas lacunae]SIS72631.1 hypothetical protein SAMN05421788_101846 [Filimonas lacunae]